MKKSKWINLSLVLIMLFSIINPFAGLNVYATEVESSETLAEQPDPIAAEQQQQVEEATTNEIVEIPDPNLEREIRYELNRVDDQPLTKEDLLALESLGAGNRGVSSLEGLQYATNLTYLNAQDGQVEDIAPLKNLTKLEKLSLEGNQISDVASLADLTSLTYLNLSINNITDISPLANLTNLEHIRLLGNEISSIEVLGNFTNLKIAALDVNSITDIEVLHQLKNSLEEVTIYENPIDFENPPTKNTLGALKDAGVDIQYSLQYEEKIYIDTETTTQTSIDIYWSVHNPVSTVLSYDILVNDKKIETVDATQLEYHIDNLEPGTTYNVQVIAHTMGGFEIASDVKPIKTTRNDLVDTTVKIVTDKGNAPDFINLWINGKSEDLQDVSIYGNPDDEGYFVDMNNEKVIQLAPGTYELETHNYHIEERTYTEFTVETGQDYLANPIIITVDEDKVRSPLYLDVFGVTESSVTVNWYQYINNDEAKTYKIYQGEQLIKETEEFTFEHTFSGLEPETEYTFKIEIVKRDGSVDTILGSAITAVGPTGIEIPFKDQNLEQVVKDELGIVDRKVRESDMEHLYWLSTWSAGITDLSGLEYAVHLEDLYVGYNEITDLSPIATLPNLSSLELDQNKITNLKPLETLPNLEYVSVVGNGEEFSDENMEVIKNLITNGVEVRWMEPWLNSVVISDLTEAQMTFSVEFPKLKDFTATYNVYLGEDFVGSFTPEEETFTIQDLTAETDYEVRVEAVDENGNTWTNASQYVTTKTAPAGDLVIFADPALEQVVREFLQVQSRDLYASDLEGLYYLYAYDRGIVDLTGLEYATNLEDVHLGKNAVENFDALSNLENLRWLSVNYNNLSSLEPFTKIPNLQYLDVYYNKITDLTPLAKMQKLQGIGLKGNGLRDISGLASVPNLTYVSVAHNELTDISPLENLTALEDVDVSFNEITDISVLLGLDNLYYGTVYNNALDLTEGSEDMKVINALEEKIPMFIYQDENEMSIEVSLGKVTRSSIEVDWSSVPEDVVYGGITQYDIFVNGEKVASDIEDTHYVLEGLEQGTNYQIEVVFTETGDELIRGSVEVKTLSDEPIEEPGEEQPPIEEPGEEQPPVEEPGEEQPPVEEPGEEQPPVEEPGEEQPPVEEPGEEQPPVEEPGEEQPPVEEPSEEQPPVEEPGEEQPSVEEPKEEQPTEQPAPEKQQPVVTKPVINKGTAKVPTDVIEKVKTGETLVVNLDTADSAKVELTKEQVKTLKDKGADFVVENHNVQLQIPLNNLPEGKKVETVVQKMKPVDEAVSNIYDFTILADGEAVHTFDEPITLVFEVNVDKVENPDNLQVFYFNETTEEWELIPGAVYQDGKVSVDTSHFSIFTVFEVANSSDKVVTETPEPENKLPETETTEEDTPEVVTPEDNKVSDNEKSAETVDSKTSESNTATDKNTSGDKKAITDTKEADKELPVTATNYYTLLLGGIVLLAIGAVLMMTRRKFAKR